VRHILIIILVGLIFISILEWDVNYQISQYQQGGNPEQNESTFFGGAVALGLSDGLANFWHWLYSNREELLVIFAAALFLVTAILAQYTKKLWRSTADLVEKTEKTTKLHERAYVFGGGPFGQPDGAGGVLPDWFMTIQNWGRTVAFVKKVRWGLYDADKFPESVSVSKLVEGSYLPAGIVQTVVKDDIYPPTGATSLPYFWVAIKHEENIGRIFFGKIDYEDVFREAHYSTFKLKLIKGGSKPLPGCYSEDKD